MNSARTASTIVVNGLFSAKGCSHDGIDWTGTNADDTNVSGNRKREADRVRRLRRGRDEPDQREDPGEGVPDEQQQRDAREDLRHIGVEAEADGEPDGEHDDELDHVQPYIGRRAAREHGGARHRQRAEAVHQALLHVVGEPERGHETAEHHGLHEDPRQQEVDVVEAGRADRAAEDVDEQQHEHDRLHRVADEQIGLAPDAKQRSLRHHPRVAEGRCDAHSAASSSA